MLYTYRQTYILGILYILFIHHSKSQTHNVELTELLSGHAGEATKTFYLKTPHQAAISIQLDNLEFVCADACHDHRSILAHDSGVDEIVFITRDVVLSIVVVYGW